MPFNPANQSPGVYVFEQSSGVHTITGVATSITAFIGTALRGPTEPTAITSYADFIRTFGGQDAGSTLGSAVNDFFLNGGTQAVIVRVIALPTGSDGLATLKVGGLGLVASSPGTWGRKLKATTDKNTKKINGQTNDKLFNLSVTDGGITENFFNLSTDHNDPNFAPFVLEQNSTLVRVGKKTDGTWDVPDTVSAQTDQGADQTSGSDGNAIGKDQLIGDANKAGKTGLYALDKVDLVNLLYIPPYLSNGSVDTDVIKDAAPYCEQRRAFLIIDSPSSWTLANTALQQMADPQANLGTTSDHAAVFFPRVKKLGQTDYTPPGGIIAGIFAQTDAKRGVWKAPAGVDAVLNGVGQLSVALNDGDNGQLNSLGLNCLRSFPVTGRVVWGARTLQGADNAGSEYKYIPVRRTALYIEESLYRGLQWAVFEPNDEPLWAQIRLNVGAFMNTLFRQGAFQGKTPRDAYFVKCDKETTTQNDIDRGIVNIVVGFAPLKPAEFVVVTIEQMAGQLQV